jgi:hypothetical protein
LLCVVNDFTSAGLHYDAAADQYTYAWKMDKDLGGRCRQLVVAFGPNAGPYNGSQAVFTLALSD